MKLQLVNEDYLQTFIPEFMSAEEMIEHIKSHRDHFISYFEAIVNSDGEVALSVPSHEKRVMEEATKDEIDNIPMDCNPMLYIAEKHGLVLCWFDSIRTPPEISDKAKETLKKLEDEGIIRVNTIIANKEYTNWLYRESLKKNGGIYNEG